MIIKKIKANELETFIFSNEYKASHVLPISRHRALSHIKNPRVKDEDVVLIMAYNEQNRLIGYLGIFADAITIRETKHRAGWFSCLWVDENTRGQGIAKTLLNEAFQAWNHQLLVTEFTSEAKSLYDRTGEFVDLKISNGIRGYLRSNLNELLAPKHSFFLNNKKVIQAIDAVLNLFHGMRLLLYNYSINHIKFEYVSQIDSEIKELVEKYKTFTSRTADDLDWILKNPWIINAPFPDAFSKRYHFSSLNTNFHFYPVKIYNDQNELIAFLILSVKGKNLKVPYCFFNPNDIDKISKLIYAHMLSMKLNMLTVFNPALVNHIKLNKTPFYYKKDVKRHYIISKKFQEDIKQEEVIFQDGDADCAFS